MKCKLCVWSVVPKLELNNSLAHFQTEKFMKAKKLAPCNLLCILEWNKVQLRVGKTFYCKQSQSTAILQTTSQPFIKTSFHALFNLKACKQFRCILNVFPWKLLHLLKKLPVAETMLRRHIPSAFCQDLLLLFLLEK